MNNLRFEVADGVARVMLDRPDARNALDPDLAASLHQAARRCADDDAVRCVLLSGSGGFFSVGGDIGFFANQGAQAEDAIGALAREVHKAVLLFATMAKPLVTAINGPAAGAGLSLAILGDLVIAAASAHFTAGYSAIGMTPDGGLTWLLPRLVGIRRAQDMILTNRRIGAAEAVAIGLVTKVVPDGQLADEADMVAHSLARGAVRTLGTCRQLLITGTTNDLATHLDVEACAIGAAGAAAEGREGVAAFLEKRAPRFEA
jgi:2-(1,2-epoxy-1,2-dihydrophenyl)acetyl-CoA isomerase